MVRSRRILEVIEADGLFARAADMGAYLLAGLEDLAGQLPEVGDVRGRGLMVRVQSSHSRAPGMRCWPRCGSAV